MIRIHSFTTAGLLPLLAAACALASGQAHAARAYVSNEEDGTVSIVDTDKMAVIATIPVGKRPRGMVLSHDGTRLYVAVSGLPKCPPPLTDEQCEKLPKDPKSDGVAVVDTMTLTRIRLLKGVSDPERVELSRDEHTIYATAEDAAKMVAIDINHGKVTATVAVGREPEGVRLSPNAQLLLVTSESDNNVAIIDPATYRILATVLVGVRPRDIAFTADSSAAFVQGEQDGSLYRIALPSGAPATQVLQMRKEAKPMGLLLDVPRGRLYVTTGRGGTLAVVSAADGTLSQEIPVGARPWGIALTTDRRHMITANGRSNDITFVDADTLAVTGKLTVGQGPWGVVTGP